MVYASDIEGATIARTGGEALGTVRRVLYHPSEPRAIGLMVAPPAMAGMSLRAETFLPLSAVEFGEGGLSTSLAKLPTGRKAADGLGFDPDTTVIWTGMDVRGPADATMGIVSDTEIDPASGAVRAMEVAGGALADTAHGRYRVPADLIVGYADGAVRISVEAVRLETSGGFAKTAARGVVAAAAVVRDAGEAAESAAVAAGRATGKAIRAAKDAQLAEKAARRVGGTWRDTIDAFKQGLHGDD